MQKFTSVRFELVTGPRGSSRAPRMVFNGFELELVRESGGTAGGETFVGSYEVGSVAHTVELLGPGEDAVWDLQNVNVDYLGAAPAQRRYEQVTLTGDERLDVWTEAAPSFDV